jgi:hypothetical protein
MKVTRRHLLWTAALPMFGGGNREFLRLDLRSGEISGTLNPETAILPGSLVKPFTALAYGASHANRFPAGVQCKGCWGGRAHGEVDLVRALSLSCNHYFEQLSLRIDPRQMQLTAAEYGLPAPPDDIEARIGLGRTWRIAPRDLLRAYQQLRSREILEALRVCAEKGTAQAVGAGSLAKTGTSPCEHTPSMPGDGLAVALWPAMEPRMAVLVREHGVPGAIAARRIPSLLQP